VAVLAYQRFLKDVWAQTGLDILHFSLYPWALDTLALACGLLLSHAALFWGGVLLLRLALAPWCIRRSPAFRVGMIGLALLPALAACLRLPGPGGWSAPWGPLLFAVLAVAATAYGTPTGLRQYRHATQAFRLVLAFAALLVPALVMYPFLVQFADQGTRRVIETQFAPQVINQREELQLRVLHSLEQIDRLTALPDLVATGVRPPGGVPPTESAFLIWAQTDLAAYRLASAIELYGADGSLVSRFALNLPEYTSTAQTWSEGACQWDLFEEVSPFGAEERRLLHAGRGVCGPAEGPGVERAAEAGTAKPAVQATSPMLGTIVIHVMLDYDSLAFLSSQSPYFELFRATEPLRREGASGGDIEFTVWGWSRAAIYMSGAIAWALDDDLFRRVYASRQPFWTAMSAGGSEYEVYLLNDRAGVYALGYPATSWLGHLVNLAELATLAGATFVALLVLGGLCARLTGARAQTGRALFREIRSNFYRKLFLAFVAASVIPVLTLAFVARAYFASRLLADVESAAAKTTAVAKRVIEDYGTLPQRGASTLSTLDDDILVWIRRIIEQDVNVFDGPALVATSERDLFASGLLPTRTPADVYRAIVLHKSPSHIGEERAGEFRYMLASAPVRTGEHDQILTVPLTLRQREIEREINDLNRRITLVTLLFILVGAGIGYSMAERIADPVNRLTRATKRIARGELDVRIAATSSDELRRLVEAFNSMASDLQRQRDQLERTHRLEVWAEMARQVAHEIKNPLTPIQLSAEHLRRVHKDRGQPLAPVLDECVDSILSQVRLLRQISSEFSSFAASPTPRPLPTSVADLIEEVVQPYRMGLEGRIRLEIDVPSSLPMPRIDRSLVGRALTNVIENALHAMAGSGTLTIEAAVEPHGDHEQIRLRIADTGVGMDETTLQRLFEPYFSTKAAGTGLGLAIARRNLELSGGRIEVQSEKGRGTTVIITLPVPAISD
jgi:signal transduction histidine kinase